MNRLERTESRTLLRLGGYFKRKKPSRSVNSKKSLWTKTNDKYGNLRFKQIYIPTTSKRIR